MNEQPEMVMTMRKLSCSKDRPDNRFIIWIDAVGGFLTCLGNEITLGQAGPEAKVDLPIVGDLSRLHASLRRSGEGYVIEPAGAEQRICIGGRKLQGPSPLFHEDLIELGMSVRLRFCQPNRLSSTARLDFVSPHNMHPAVDGIILMAEACILGPASNCHIPCPDWSSDMVIFRRDCQLFCQGKEPIEINGKACKGAGLLLPSSHVTGADFAWSIEAMEH